MADIFCRGAHLLIDDVGDRDLRVTLLSLEPGSRIWLSLDGDLVLFERVSELEAERAYRAVGPSSAYWTNRSGLELPSYIEELQIVERPKDSGAAGNGFYRLSDRSDVDFIS